MKMCVCSGGTSTASAVIASGNRSVPGDGSLFGERDQAAHTICYLPIVNSLHLALSIRYVSIIRLLHCISIKLYLFELGRNSRKVINFKAKNKRKKEKTERKNHLGGKEFFYN